MGLYCSKTHQHPTVTPLPWKVFWFEPYYLWKYQFWFIICSNFWLLRTLSPWNFRQSALDSWVGILNFFRKQTSHQPRSRGLVEVDVTSGVWSRMRDMTKNSHDAIITSPDLKCIKHLKIHHLYSPISGSKCGVIPGKTPLKSVASVAKLQNAPAHRTP